MKRFLILVGSVAIFPSICNGQARGGGMSAPAAHAAPAMHAPAVAAPHGVAPHGTVHPAMAATTHPAGAARVVGRNGAVRVRTVNGVTHVMVRRSNSITPMVTPPIGSRVVVPGRPIIVNDGDLDDLTNFRTVPGLGFDFPHLAAVFGPNAVGAGRFQRFNSLGTFFPFIDGGFFLPTPAPIVVDEESDANQAEAAPQTTKNQMAAQTTEPPRGRVSEPPRDSTQYVFVRRDGTLLFAVAYSWENSTTLRYITSQGTRATVSRDALDLDATHRFNEERGLSFQAPA